MKKGIFLVSCFLLLASLSVHAAAYDPSLEWKTIKTPHFEIHYGVQKGTILSGELLPSVAQKAAVYLEEAHEKLSPRFDWVPWGRTQVIVTDSNDIANGTASTLPYNWLHLRASSPDPDSILSNYDNWLRTLAFHEYTHILHIDQCRGVMKVPRYILGKVVGPNGTVTGWMREGIATYDETVETTAGRGRASYSEMLLRTAILEGRFPKIDQADGLGWRWPSFQGMYIYGVKFLQYLADRYGEEKLLEFHKEVAGSPFIYALNHHARVVFNDIKFESKRVHTHYTKVKRSGEPKSKTFYDMWDEWREGLTEKYKKVKVEVEAGGLSEFGIAASGETVLSSPAVSPDGRYLAYARGRAKGPAEIHLKGTVPSGELSPAQEDKVIKKRQLPTHISFSPDSRKIIYSAIGSFKTYNQFGDIYSYDIEGKKVEQLTKGARASDPSFSPDGKKILFVKQEAGRSWLAVYDAETKETSEIPPFPHGVRSPPAKADEAGGLFDVAAKGPDPKKGGEGGFIQFSSPTWSPDGKYIAVASHQKGQWDIYLLKIKNQKSKIKIVNVYKLTDDPAIDTHPVWSADGKAVYFASDRTGISNIYRITLSPFPPPFRHYYAGGQARGRVREGGQVTNVLTGVFQPAVSPDGRALYVQYYNGEGFDIRSLQLGSRLAVRDAGIEARNASRASRNDTRIEERETSTVQLQDKKYNPLGKSLFLPRFVIPNFATLDNAVYLGAFTGGADPLRWHNWTGGVNYRTDLSKYVGYFFNYWYNQKRPVLSAGMNAYAVKYSTTYNFCANADCTSTYSKRLFEERLRGYGGVSLPWGKQSFGLSYFYEDRSSNLTAGEFNGLAALNLEPNLGRYTGFSLSYNYGHVEKYPASISYEKGRRLRTNFAITDKWTGSSEPNEQRIFVGDYREYVSLPWANHVIALRTHGGITWGDTLRQGAFIMGGALGEGAFGGGDSLYYFPLRGLPIAAMSRTRALLFSGEYRIPVASPQRGLGTLPFYLESLHLAPFVDYGNAWFATTDTWGNGRHFFDDFLLSVGAEGRADFVVGHGLPVTGRLGYAVIVVNRDRIQGINDPLLDTPAKYGMLILQLGTSF